MADHNINTMYNLRSCSKIKKSQQSIRAKRNHIQQVKVTSLRVFILLLLHVLLFSCHRNSDTSLIELKPSPGIEKSMLEVNRFIAKRNRDHIHSFVRRTGWEMKQTGSGLWITIAGEGAGNYPEPGQRILMDYSLRLIDGTEISSSSKMGPLEFIVGQRGVESGLEEAALLLKSGNYARIILPPHLAFGNFGNPQKNVPPDAILLYEIRVLSIH